MPDQDATIDGEVVRLRSLGHSFARIGRDLGLSGTTQAHDAFHQAIRHLPDAERARIQSEEMFRLTRLAERVRDRAEMPIQDRTKQLHLIDRLKTQLTAEMS